MISIENIWKRSFFRFLLVGASATLLDYGIYWLLSAGIGNHAAKALSITVACVYSYALNKTFTFRSAKKGHAGLLPRYLISQVVNISLNTGTNALVLHLSGNKLLGVVCATAVGMTANYLLQKFFVFGPGERKTEHD